MDFFILFTHLGVQLHYTIYRMKLYLQREPKNSFDPNAVAIYMEIVSHQLGYIPKETAKIVARMIDSGRKLNCYIEQINIASTGIIGINIRITEGK